MPARRDNSNRSDAFGRLLSGAINSIATYEGRTTPVVEEELGQLLSLSGKTIQRYKAGYLPPDHETVKVLAEAAVRRGFLDREWLQRFLHAARYPFADTLLDQLRPIGPVRPRPPRVYENLPAPTYSQFVMRQQAFAEVTDGLGKRTAAVLIVGLGGNGKTSLAREVAAHCLRDEGDAPRFDAVVWASDKDRPGTTNLSIVLDEIARTLDYPGFTQFEHDEKRREVEQLLRRQRVLLVVDNFETITDGALLTWLLNLPEPSKALITSREKHRGLWSSWLVELRGMAEGEAWELITERASVLKIDRLVGERTQLEPLLAATGGNPKALTMTLGLLKYERRPLQDVVDDLYAARGDLFDDLFTRAWALLDEAARRVLLVATFFPTNASAEALGATADVQGFAFDRAVERLADLALLDVQQADLSSSPRYALHPLVRAFAGAKLTEQVGFEAGARERWGAYFTDFVTDRAGSIESALETVEVAMLDSIELDIETIHTVLDFYDQHEQWQPMITLTLALEEFWQTRGYFKTSNAYARRALSVAQAHNDHKTQVQLLYFVARDAFYQNNAVEVRRSVVQAHSLLDIIEQPEETLLVRYYRTLRYIYDIEGDIEQRYAMTQQIIALGRLPEIEKEKRFQDAKAGYFYATNQNSEAEDLLLTLVSDDFFGTVRRIGQWVQLARIAIRQQQSEIADERLRIAENLAMRINHRGYLAIMKLDRARIEVIRNNHEAARAFLVNAISELERRGSLRGLIEARTELEQLERRGE